MKKIFSFVMIAALAVILGGCNKYDDSELRTEINNLKARLDAVESLNNYKDLLAKLDKGKTVTGVSENNGVYTLTFDDNSTITFNQKGEPGAPGESIIGPEGKPGISPQIKNEDGKWWISTDNGQTWNEAGSSVGTPGEPGAPGAPGTPGTPGENGITPKFRINEAKTTWEVSYDNGETWTEVGSAMDHSLITGVTLATDGDSITISLADGTAIVVPCDDPNAVDMGLSVKWAKCNLGAASPEEAGYFIAWGELEEKSEYTWATYKHCAGEEKTITKYCKFTNYGTPDMLEFLEPEDDAVIQTLGGKWRIPTYDEAKALTDTKDNPDYTWELSEVNGHSGYWVTYLVNGNKIFLPAAGYKSPDGHLKENAYGTYWTSRVNFGFDITGLIFSIITDPNDRNFKYTPGTGYYSRHYGCQIRPVKDK